MSREKSLHGYWAGAYITEQQIDDYLIANHKDDEATLSSFIADQQNYEDTLKMVSESNV